MILFSDTDIILKLASLDLLEEALVALDCSKGEVRVLPTARFQLKSANLEKKFGTQALARARDFVNGTSPIEGEPALAEFQCLLDANLDPGEAAMFACALSSTDIFVSSGDKRALEALATHPGCRKLVRHFSRRVFCLEYIVLQIITTNDFDSLLPKLVAGYDCDTAIRAAFGSGMKAQLENVVRSLESRVADLNERTGGTLLVVDPTTKQQ